jgi:hypothetical protein
VTSISNINIAGGQYQVAPAQFIYQVDAIIPIFSIITQSVLPNPPPPGTTVDSYSYADAGAWGDGILSIANSGGTGDREISFPGLLLFETTSGVAPRYWITAVTYALRIRGLATITFGPWNNRSNEIANGLNVKWQIGAEVYYPATTTNGTPSSAFGFSAPGGTEGTPQPSTFVASVAVNPGQTYTITVGSPSGQVNFQFTQG